MGRVVAEDGVDAHNVCHGHEEHDEEEKTGRAVHDDAEKERSTRLVASLVPTLEVASSVSSLEASSIATSALVVAPSVSTSPFVSSLVPTSVSLVMTGCRAGHTHPLTPSY